MTNENFTILLADDDETARLLMRAAIEKEGYRVLSASDGEEAVRLFTQALPDMVMLDVAMPGMDGYQVCAFLRARMGRELPIVMVTGMDDMESITRAFEAGATDFIAKPINWGLLGYRILYLRRAYLNVLALKNANARSHAIFNAIPDAMFILNNTGEVVEMCSSPDTLPWLSDHLGDLPSNRGLPEALIDRYLGAIEQARLRNMIELFEYAWKLETDEVRYYENRLAIIDAQRTLCLMRDITERKDSENKIYSLEYFDRLTGLLNRQSFVERLENEIRHTRYNSGKLAVLFLDLDGFKSVNDTMGHATGDRILRWVADRLQGCALEPGDFLSRGIMDRAQINLAHLGADEFAVVIPNLACAEDAMILAHRIREGMHYPFHVAGRDVVLTISVGIACYPEDGADAGTLLKHADTAMHHAKGEGRDNCQFYDAALTLQAENRLHLENDLRNALRRDEFYLMYQPQFDITGECFQSVEALIRWRHPQRGLVSPLDFIPLAEANGLIIPIGEWVLRTACSDAVQWHSQGYFIDISVNLSPLQFKSPDWVKTVLNVLAETNFPPDKLILEITEGALMENTQAALAALQALRDHGIKIALDDFGTGYSSMSYLKRLPINCIKIDQSFIRDFLDDKENLAIVKAIISLSKNLGFSVTAEGVETLHQAEILKSLGCDMLQGYYFSKPVVAEELCALTNRRWPIALCEVDG